MSSHYADLAAWSNAMTEFVMVYRQIPAAKRAEPIDGGWGPRQLLEHLMDAEIIFSTRMRAAIANPGSAILPFDQDLYEARVPNEHVPDDLLCAARIDGCSEFGIYWRIVVPIARPALAALGIIILIGTWNNLMWAFIILRTKDMQTLPLVIYLLQGEQRTPFGMLMAGGLLTTLPLVIGFLLFQRHFISGITSGAIKA